MSNIEYCLYQRNTAPLYAQIERLDPTQRFKVTVTPWKSKRSLAQNKWVRGYAKDLGKHLGYEPDEMYEILMYKFNPLFITDKETSEVIRLPGHFSSLKTDAAAEVQNEIQRWASGLGFYWDGQ